MQLIITALTECLYIQESQGTITYPELADTPDYILYRDRNFTEAYPRIIFVGGSNVRRGFIPAELEPHLPNIHIYNLSVSAPNITELRQVVDTLLDQIPPVNLTQTTMVLGVWVGCFVDDTIRWPLHHTEFDSDKIESHLYVATPSGEIIARIPVDTMHTAGIFLMPRRFLVHYYRQFLQYITPNHSPDRKALMDTWNNYFGHSDTLTDKQFEALLDLAKYVSSRGVHLLVVDMPIANWLESTAPQFQDYQRRKEPYLKQLQIIKNVSYFNMQDMNADPTFIDTVHPKPEYTHLWADRIRPPIKAASPFPIADAP